VPPEQVPPRLLLELVVSSMDLEEVVVPPQLDQAVVEALVLLLRHCFTLARYMASLWLLPASSLALPLSCDEISVTAFKDHENHSA
jgi:hypothetical protein